MIATIKWENEIVFGLLGFGLLCAGLLWVVSKLSSPDDDDDDDAPLAGGLCA